MYLVWIVETSKIIVVPLFYVFGFYSFAKYLVAKRFLLNISIHSNEYKLLIVIYLNSMIVNIEFIHF